MSFLRWLNCWIFSHEAHNNEILTVNFFGEELFVSICACCNATIMWNEEKQAWIRW